MKVVKTGLVIAAAAALLTSGVSLANEKEKGHMSKSGMVKCQGANVPMSKQDKEKGYVEMKSADECTKAGGTVMSQ